MSYLVDHDVDRIKAYIFATNKLREIRGASALVRLANLEAADLVGNYGGQRLIGDGGRILARFNNIDQARAYCYAVGRIYEAHTHLLTSTGVVVEEDPNDWPTTYARCNEQLRLAKLQPKTSRQAMGHRLTEWCGSCRSAPAEPYQQRLLRWLEDHPGIPQPYRCSACFAKWAHTTPNAIVQTFLDMRNLDINAAASDMEEIGAASKPPRYVGMVTCDANRMGERFGRIANPGHLSQVSEQVDITIRDTCVAVLHQLLGGCTGSPFQIALHGGDDLIVILPASYALPFAEQFTTLASQALSDIFQEPCSISAGVVLAQDSHPMSRLFHLSEALLRSAKKGSHKHRLSNGGAETSFVDFQVITTPHSGADLLAQRGDMTRRPYSGADLACLLETTCRIRATGVPRTHLQGALEALWASQIRTELHWLRMKDWTRECDQRRQALELLESAFMQLPGGGFDGRQTVRILPDVIEIWDFCR